MLPEHDTSRLRLPLFLALSLAAVGCPPSAPEDTANVVSRDIARTDAVDAFGAGVVFTSSGPIDIDNSLSNGTLAFRFLDSSAVTSLQGLTNRQPAELGGFTGFQFEPDADELVTDADADDPSYRIGYDFVPSPFASVPRVVEFRAVSDDPDNHQLMRKTFDTASVKPTRVAFFPTEVQPSGADPDVDPRYVILSGRLEWGVYDLETDGFVSSFNAARPAGSQATVVYDGVEVNTTSGAQLKAGDGVAAVYLGARQLTAGAPTRHVYKVYVTHTNDLSQATIGTDTNDPCPTVSGEAFGRKVSRYLVEYDPGTPGTPPQLLTSQNTQSGEIVAAQLLIWDLETETDPANLTDEEKASLTCGPEGIAANQRDKEVYVANYHTGSVSIVDATDRAFGTA